MKSRLREMKRQDLRPIPEGQSESNSESESGHFSSAHNHVSSDHISLQISTRLQEKEELQELNDRLFQYIEFIQASSFVPNSSTLNLDKTLNSFKKQASKLSLLYTGELNAMRNQLDEMALRLADCQIQLSSARSTSDTMTKRLQDAQDREARAIDKVTAMTTKIAKLENELLCFQQLKADHDELFTQNSVLKKQLETETLLRTDLQNRLITTTEKIAFLERLLQEERETVRGGELHSQLQAATAEARQYRLKLKEALDNWRVEPAEQLELVKERFEKVLQSELAAQQSRVAAAESHASRLSEEVDRLRSLLAARDAELSKCRIDLEESIRRLNAVTNDQQSRSADVQIATEAYLTAERDRLLALLEEKTREHVDLLGVKVQLDTELAMYRKLLEAEEFRCNLSPASANLTRKPVVVGRRRSAWTTSTKASAVDTTSVDLDAVEEMTTMTQEEEEEIPDCRPAIHPISLRASAVGTDTPVTRCRGEGEVQSHLTSCSDTRITDSSGSAALRVTCSSAGPIHFANVDPVCGVLSIHNASDETADLSGWHLHYGPTESSDVAGEDGEHESASLVYSFPADQLLLPHSELRMTIYTPSRLRRLAPATTGAEQGLRRKSARLLSGHHRASDPPTPPPPSLLHLVTRLPVWSWCRSVLALQNPEGIVEALCELEPVSVQ